MKNPKNLKQRKTIRKPQHNYGGGGTYFVTINCKNFKHLFGKVEPILGDANKPIHLQKGQVALNEAGKIAKACWEEIPKHYQTVKLHAFVIMPNHIHGIIEIPKPPQQQLYKPNQCNIIKGFKIGVTKWFRKNTEVKVVWHRSFYDIIIKDTRALNNITQYINNNPSKWLYRINSKKSSRKRRPWY